MFERRDPRVGNSGIRSHHKLNSSQPSDQSSKFGDIQVEQATCQVRARRTILVSEERNLGKKKLSFFNCKFFHKSGKERTNSSNENKSYEECKLTSLPPELSDKITSYLDLESQKAWAGTCRYFAGGWISDRKRVALLQELNPRLREANLKLVVKEIVDRCETDKGGFRFAPQDLKRIRSWTLDPLTPIKVETVIDSIMDESVDEQGRADRRLKSGTKVAAEYSGNGRFAFMVSKKFCEKNAREVASNESKKTESDLRSEKLVALKLYVADIRSEIEDY